MRRKAYRRVRMLVLPDVTSVATVPAVTRYWRVYPVDQANGGALLANVRERGEQLRQGLEQLRLKYPDTIAGEDVLVMPFWTTNVAVVV